MPQAKRKHQPGPSADPSHVPPDRNVNELRPGIAEGAPFKQRIPVTRPDWSSAEWQEIAKACEEISQCNPEEKAAGGPALAKALGDLIFLLGYRRFSTGEPDLPGSPILPSDNDKTGVEAHWNQWRELVQRTVPFAGALAALPADCVMARRAQDLEADIFPLLVEGFRWAESKLDGLQPAPTKSYDRGPRQPRANEPEPVPTQRKSTKSKTVSASGEVTNRKKTKTIGADVDPATAKAMTAIAATVGLRVGAYVAEMIDQHVKANPELVARGEALLAGGVAPAHRVYRTVGRQLMDENKQLKAMLSRAGITVPK